MRLADRQDGIEVEVLGVARDTAGTFHLNCPEIPESCVLLKFFGLIDVGQVFVDGAGIDAEQLGHLLLGKPDGLVLDAYINGKTALGREDGEVRVGRGVGGHLGMLPPSPEGGKLPADESSGKFEWRMWRAMPGADDAKARGSGP